MPSGRRMRAAMKSSYFCPEQTSMMRPRTSMPGARIAPRFAGLKEQGLLGELAHDFIEGDVHQLAVVLDGGRARRR